MHRTFRLAAVIACLGVAGCNGTTRPSESPPPSGGGNTITGRERFGWTQTAASAQELGLYRFALYVDGARRVIEGENCAPAAAATTFDCSAPLPTMTPGSHTLELAAFVTSGDQVLESPRSAPLQVTIAAVTAPQGAAEAGAVESTDGLRFMAAVLAGDLVDPVDLAVSTDGRIIVAERSGAVRVIGRGDGRQAAENVIVHLARGADAAALLSVALAPDFAESGVLHAAYGSTEGGRHRIHLARMREVGGTFGETALIASYEVPPGASAILRSGADAILYLGVGAGADAAGAQNLGMMSGKILRMLPDGRTPDDNPWRSPVFSLGLRDPRALAWRPGTGTLWALDAHDTGDELNAITAGANYGWPPAGHSRSHRGVTLPVLRVQPGAELSGAAFVPASDHPLAGDLIASSLAAADLLRVRFDDEGNPRLTARLLQGRYGRIAQVAAGPDGAVYFITANAPATGPDLLVRLLPAPPR